MMNRIAVTAIFFPQEDNLLPPEQKQEGAVSSKTYLAYFRAFHNLGTAFVVIFLFALCQVRTAPHIYVAAFFKVKYQDL